MKVGIRFHLGIVSLFLSGWLACAPKPEEKPETPEPEVASLTPKQALGKELFFDENLSTPPGQSCATCHDPARGFANPDDSLPVSRGVHPDRFGNRNDLPSAYASFSPPLHYDAEEEVWVGGNFWDGRASGLVEQAKLPLLNPLEMANPDEEAVVARIRAAQYAGAFREVFGADALDDTGRAYQFAAEAMAAFQESPEVNRFSSKYDFVLRGEAALTPSEARGLALYEDPKKGNCAACHPHTTDEAGQPPLFTDFTYDNLGVPKNPELPFYHLPPSLNPDGLRWVDLGLGPVVKKASENGKFRVPTLRNAALTGPYMHNGVFKTLRQVVMFYNTRDVSHWPPAEYPKNLNRKELGNLRLSNTEVDDLVAFMLTLTDGYAPPAPPAVSASGGP